MSDDNLIFSGPMNAMPFVIGTIAVFAIAYRLYFSFVAAKVAVKNDLALDTCQQVI